MLQTQIHKRINFNFQGQKLLFDTSQELFSFAKVDDGTKELLNSLRKNPSINYRRILDFGCGYGIIGIFLKKIYPESEVLCSDRDSLAIDFAEHNAKLNEVKLQTITSLDYNHIYEKFSLIVCNFPAKLEKEGLKYFISESSQHLDKNGELAIVVVKELAEELENIIAEYNAQREKIKISFKQQNADYLIYHLSFIEKLEKINFSYMENELSLQIEGNIYPLLTTFALREWDTPHFTTDIIISLIKGLKYKDVSLINPGQGYSALAATHHKSLDRTILCSRDLLQLKISAENLELNGINKVELINEDLYDKQSDLLIWSIHDEDYETIQEKLKIYRNNCNKIIIAGKINLLNRLIKKEKIKVKTSLQKGKYLGILI